MSQRSEFCYGCAVWQLFARKLFDFLFNLGDWRVFGVAIEEKSTQNAWDTINRIGINLFLPESLDIVFLHAFLFFFRLRRSPFSSVATCFLFVYWTYDYEWIERSRRLIIQPIFCGHAKSYVTMAALIGLYYRSYYLRYLLSVDNAMVQIYCTIFLFNIWFDGGIDVLMNIPLFVRLYWGIMNMYEVLCSNATYISIHCRPSLVVRFFIMFSFPNLMRMSFVRVLPLNHGEMVDGFRAPSPLFNWV